MEEISIRFAKRRSKLKIMVSARRADIWRKTKKKAWEALSKKIQMNILEAKNKYVLCNSKYIF